MGNGESAPTKSVMASVASYVAFVGACIERKSAEISEFVEKENNQSIYVNEAIRVRRSMNRSSVMTPRTPLLSARSKQSIADREDHILLSARSIAIQKKAPLFRDVGDDDTSSSFVNSGQLSARKLDMQAINDMIEKDRIRRASAAPTPRVLATSFNTIN
jgi:hypothetical protein